MKLKFIFIVSFVISFSSLFSQPYASSNMTLLSVLDPVGGVGNKYSGCWGWTQPGTGKEYAIICSKDGTYWVDITNPVTPTVAAYKPGTSTNGTWREVKSYGNYCYVVSDDGGSTGFQIFDMSTLPATVTLVSSNQTLFRRGHAAWVDDNKLYVSGVTYSTGNVPASSSMDVYSLATPSAPVLLRRLNQDYNFITYVHDEFVRNDTVFASCGYQGLHVFKYSVATNSFVQLGSLTSYTASGYNHASALTPNGKTLFFMDEVPAGLPIKVADVSNLANISVLSTCNQFTQTTPHNPFMINNQYCFASSYQDGSQLWDISNPSSPVLAGYFDTHPESGGNNNTWLGAYNGQWGMFPYFPSGNIIALDRKNGLFVFNTNLYTMSEIQIMGNNVDINDGDVYPSISDNTNFGSVNMGNNVSNNFSIKNLGLAPLSVSSLSITGANAPEFALIGVPASPFTIAATSQQSLTIQFVPLGAGTRTALLTVYNSDLSESIFQFVIEGTGNVVPPLGINNLNNSTFKFSVFPNPVKNEIEFNIPAQSADKEIQINIYDQTGKIVLHKNNNEIIKTENLLRKTNIGELNNGIYTISIYSGNEIVANKKIVISK